MKRVKLLIGNTVWICIILTAMFFSSGFYFSKEKCAEHTMRSLYVPEGEVVQEIRSGNHLLTLIKHENSFSLIGTKKVGLFYHTSSCFTECLLKQENSFSFWTGYNAEVGAITVIFRNDERIASIEVETNDIGTVVFDEWNEDYAVFVSPKSWKGMGLYRAYDALGNLIEEIDYLDEIVVVFQLFSFIECDQIIVRRGNG